MVLFDEWVYVYPHTLPNYVAIRSENGSQIFQIQMAPVAPVFFSGQNSPPGPAAALGTVPLQCMRSSRR